jgi:putative ABC transport system permease protein
MLLVYDQWSYDRFHEEHERIVRIVVRGERTALAAMPAYLGPTLEQELTFVEQSLRIGQIRADVEANGKAFALEGLAADPSFLELFDFELLAGDRSTALVGPGKVVLSDAAAERYFGTADPMGEAIEIRGYGGPYTVSGVVRTRDVNSHLRFDLLASFATLLTDPEWAERVDAEDNYHSFATYLLLQDRPSADLLQAVLADYGRPFGDARHDLVVQPLTSITLGTSYANEISAYNLPGMVVWMLAGLGLLVMLAAGFNYVGLATAQSVQRAREVGVGKVVGARRRQVAAQFLAESIVLSLVALVFAIVLVSVLLPVFNSVSFLQRLGIELSMEDIPLPLILAISGGFSVFVGFLAGAYPAARISGFRPVWVLKGQLSTRTGSAGRLRQGLTFVQLVIALTAIVTTVLLFRQFEHLLSADLGFRSAGVVTVALQGNDLDLLRDELERQAGVEGVASIAGCRLRTARLKPVSCITTTASGPSRSA